jgi:uncharacterized membrane protein YeaQ/YmgE (transglycosylase-associated protein family)
VFLLSLVIAWTINQPQKRLLAESVLILSNERKPARNSEFFVKLMVHLLWYIVVGLIAGVIAKSVLHVHMLLIWTIVLGVIGSILGGAVTHLFVTPTNERFHPAGLILSTIGAILVLYICIKLGIRFPRVG